MKKKISLYTPCYNEEGNVYDLYQRVTEIMKTLPEYEYEYIFIDNCSTDNTENILRKIASEDKRVKVIFNLKNFGPVRSPAHAFLNTTGDATIGFSCDFQDPPELIPLFIKKWEQGSKVVFGKKCGSDENKIMYAIRCLYYRFIKMISENEQYENVTGFGLYDREVVELVKKYSRPMLNVRNMISEFGYTVDFVEYHQPKRKSGKTSYNIWGYFNIALNDMVNTSKVPLRIATCVGTLVAILSVIIAIYYFILKLMYWDSYELGIATLAVGLFFIGAVQLLCIGIVGEYVGEILTRISERPMVVEKERLNFEDDESAEK